MKISNQTIPIEFNIIILVNEQGVDMGERRIIRAESYNLPSKDTRDDFSCDITCDVAKIRDHNV